MPPSSTDTYVEFTKPEIEQSITARFEQQVATHPERLAVGTAGQTLTYAALNAIGNRIAAAIQDQRSAEAEPVALLLEQGAAAVAAILGVLKAGKFYVALDPTHPPARLRHMLEDSQAWVVVTDMKHMARAMEMAGADRIVVNVETLSASPVLAADSWKREVSPDQVAYIFHTSGSSGEPKGVADTHRNVLHNVMRYTNSLRIGWGDRLTLLQAPSFSGSVSSLFCALLNGAAVFPLNLREAGVGALAAWLIENEITMYHSVPAIFRSFLTGDVTFPHLRVVRLEGDQASRLDVDLYKRHLGSNCVLVNGLGATETGLTRQYFIDKSTELTDGPVPVGYPVSDMEVLLLDDEARDASVTSVGEIAVRSRYLAMGYWRRPDLTREAFLPDSSDPGVRIYRTGDMGRFRDDGCLEYLGRRNFQLKIRGHKVEPAEVETALLRIGEIEEAVVTTREDHAGEPRLVAYLVTTTKPGPSADVLRSVLAETLPDHLIPSAFVVLDELPLSANGKVDRLALPAPDHERVMASGNFLAARDDIERQLVEIWETVLQAHPIGVRDNFSHLGGDSLQAARVLAGAHDRLGRLLPPSALAEAPTIETLAALFRAPGAGHHPSPLVAMQPAGSRSPLFCVHDLHGDILIYAQLARHLGQDQPFYALQPVIAPVATDSPMTIESMAARYLTEIRAEQPLGPYLLGGFCFGGVVAFEMARQLRSEGQEVALLALLGITAWDFPHLVSKSAWRRYMDHVNRDRFVPRVKRHLRQLMRLPWGNRWRYFSAKTKLAYDELQHSTVVPTPPSPVARTNQAAFRSYRSRTYPGKSVVFLAKDVTETYSDDPASDWRGLAAEGVEIHVLPGDDVGLLKEPTVRALSEKLSVYLSPHAASRARAAC